MDRDEIKDKFLLAEKRGIKNLLVICLIMFFIFIFIVLYIPELKNISIGYKLLICVCVYAIIFLPIIIIFLYKSIKIRNLIIDNKYSIEKATISITLRNSIDRSIGPRYIYNIEINGKVYKNIYFSYNRYKRKKGTLIHEMPLFNDNIPRDVFVVWNKKLYVYLIEDL